MLYNAWACDGVSFPSPSGLLKVLLVQKHMVSNSTCSCQLMLRWYAHPVLYWEHRVIDGVSKQRECRRVMECTYPAYCS